MSAPQETVHRHGRAPRRAGRGIGSVLQRIALLAVVVISVWPLYWIVVTALRTDGANAAYPPSLLPRGPFTLEHVTELFTLHEFHVPLLNSVLVTTGTTLLTMALGVPAAYAIARFRSRLVQLVGTLGIVSYLLPGVLVLVPVAQILFGNGLGDNRAALVVLTSATLLPFAMWLLRGAFRDFALETEEVAMLDGCSRFGAFLRVVVPQAAPSIASTTIFIVNAAWSEYLFASTLMTSTDRLTANASIYLLMGHMGTESWGLLMAGAFVIVAPVLLTFAVAQRWIAARLTEGSGR